MPTRDQERAMKAYAAIEAVQDQTYAKKYGGLCLKLPAMIQFNGLCQTFGFLEAKGKREAQNPHTLLLGNMAVLLNKGADGAELARQVREAPLAEYLHLTREALACATWLKRYAEAVLRVQPGEDED